VTEIVEYRPNDAAAQLVAWADAARSAAALATSLVATNVCPPPFRGKPQEATAVILLGAELGLSPIAALRSMFEIRGQLGMYVRAQVALVQSRGHRIWTVRESDDEVVVAGSRRDDPDHVTEVAWTIARARQAGLIRRGRNNEPSQYELQPRSMLWARAAGDVARRIAADVLNGVPELDDPVDSGQAATAARSAPGRVIQRQPRTVEDIELPARADERPLTPQPSTSDVPTASARAEDGSPPPQESAEIGGEPEPTVPAELPPDDVEPPNEDAEPLVTRAQMNLMQALFIRAGARSPDDRHRYLSRWLDRPIESSNDITVTEASSIIDRLQAQTGGDDASA
jgi:hypothetical protein